MSREVKITEAGPQENSSQSPQTPAPEAGNTSQAGNASQPSGPSAGTGEVSRTEGAHSDTPQQSDSTSVQNQPSGTQSQTQGQTQGTVQGQAHSTSGEHAPTPPAASEGNSQSQGASSTQEGGPKTQETSGTQQQEGKVSQTSAPEGSDPQLKNESHGEATGQHSEASQRALPLQLKDLLGHEELFGEASPTADNGHISYAPSSSLVSNLIDPLHEVPMV